MCNNLAILEQAVLDALQESPRTTWQLSQSLLNTPIADVQQTILTLKQEGLLPSDPEAGAVDLWTSGNQVFKVEGLNVFKVLLTLLLDSKSKEECILALRNGYRIRTPKPRRTRREPTFFLRSFSVFSVSSVVQDAGVVI